MQVAVGKNVFGGKNAGVCLKKRINSQLPSEAARPFRCNVELERYRSFLRCQDHVRPFIQVCRFERLPSVVSPMCVWRPANKACEKSRLDLRWSILLTVSGYFDPQNATEGSGFG